MKLIVGLGNPGKEYQTTRHNAGFLIIDKLLADSSAEAKFNKGFNAEVAKTTINKKRVILAKPMTYMNNSGIAIKTIMNFYKINLENLIIIHDDKDIPLGETRVQINRGPAGHNGIKSIIEQLGTQNFIRIRVGVAPENPDEIKDTANFVLSKFTDEEMKKLKKVTENVTLEIEKLL